MASVQPQTHNQTFQPFCDNRTVNSLTTRVMQLGAWILPLALITLAVTGGFSLANHPLATKIYHVTMDVVIADASFLTLLAMIEKCRARKFNHPRPWGEKKFEDFTYYSSNSVVNTLGWSSFTTLLVTAFIGACIAGAAGWSFHKHGGLISKQVYQIVGLTAISSFGLFCLQQLGAKIRRKEFLKANEPARQDLAENAQDLEQWHKDNPTSTDGGSGADAANDGCMAALLCSLS